VIPTKFDKLMKPFTTRSFLQTLALCAVAALGLTSCKKAPVADVYETNVKNFIAASEGLNTTVGSLGTMADFNAKKAEITKHATTISGVMGAVNTAPAPSADRKAALGKEFGTQVVAASDGTMKAVMALNTKEQGLGAAVGKLMEGIMKPAGQQKSISSWFPEGTFGL